VTAQGELYAPGATGAEPESLFVSDPRELPDLIPVMVAALRRGGVRLALGLDPAEPVSDSIGGHRVFDSWNEPDADTVEKIERARSVVILAGPGVVAAGAVAALHGLAATLDAGVLNTWGAKGVFHWRSRHHWATIGLQASDFRLAGIDESDLLVAVGVDEREAPKPAWAGRAHVVLEPEMLSPLAERLKKRRRTLEMPPLRARLAAVTQARWECTGSPLAPTRATLHYGQQLSGGGLVAADAGASGFWVARTFATTALGMVFVPPQTVPGWAVACATVARLTNPLRPILAVVDGAIDEETGSVLDFARSRGVPIGVEVWQADGDALNAERHEERLGALVSPAGGGLGTLATDWSQMDEFVAVAGPVTAWTQPPPREV
jgi:thiamine pyrophosphate-dependent acetolactate synthase large subunit-like protein